MIDYARLKSSLQEYLSRDDSVSLSFAIYLVLLDEIINFRITPGTKLVLSLLSEQLGVSMTPTREALAKLSENGLVILDSGKKARVAEFNKQDYINLQLLRCALDSTAAEALCSQRAPENLAGLEQAFNHLAAIYAEYEKDPTLAVEVNKADLEYHRQLILASKNEFLIRQFELIYPRSLFMCQFLSPALPEPYHLLRLHHGIIESIKYCDTEFAVNAVRFHYRPKKVYRQL